MKFAGGADAASQYMALELKMMRHRERCLYLTPCVLPPLQGWCSFHVATHGLRRGLHSFAASLLAAGGSGSRTTGEFRPLDSRHLGKDTSNGYR